MNTTALTNAVRLLAALANAFGGSSQFNDETVGAAVFGHFNNGGQAALGGVTADEVMDAAAHLLAEQWQVEVEPTRSAIAAGFAAARARVEGA